MWSRVQDSTFLATPYGRIKARIESQHQEEVDTMVTPLNLQPNRRAAALALMHPVKPGRADHLREVLQHLGHKDIAVMQGERPICAVQWVMFDNNTRLLCTIHFHGTVEALFQDFATYGTERCRTIWGNCMGYPDGDAHTIDAIAAYLAAGQVPITAYFPSREP